MTMDDLKGLRELHRERQRIIDRMEQLRASVQRTSPNLDGMPRGGQLRRCSRRRRPWPGRRTRMRGPA